MSHTWPLLPLESWRQILGYNPWHFWGLADATIVPVTSKCNSLVYEHEYQGTDQAGRENIRNAILNAEQILFDNLGYWPAPVYSEATLPWPRYQDHRLERAGRWNARGRWLDVRLNEGKVRACGIEAFTELEDAAVLVYTDQDGDGLADTFTTSVATTVTNPDEIAVYFQTADRLFEDNWLSARWRIEPVNVSFLMGTATITGKRWQCVKPSVYEDKNHYPIDPTVASNFITHVMIYRRYTNMTGQVSSTNAQAALIWESRPCSWGCCDSTITGGTTDPASEGWVAGRSGIRDSENGIVIPAEAVYNAATGLWSALCECTDCCGEPDKVLVRYLAGVELDPKGWMPQEWRTLVARLACAELTRRICACDSANREYSNWQFDLARVEGPETYQANLDNFNNPLGTRRGHIYAWQQIQKLARAVGFLP